MLSARPATRPATATRTGVIGGCDATRCERIVPVLGGKRLDKVRQERLHASWSPDAEPETPSIAVVINVGAAHRALIVNADDFGLRRSR